jgi:hypothetical protein
VPCEIVGFSQPVCREHGETVSLRCRHETGPSARAALSLIEEYGHGALAFQDLSEALDESPLFLKILLERAAERLKGGTP